MQKETNTMGQLFKYNYSFKCFLNKCMHNNHYIALFCFISACVTDFRVNKMTN